MDKTRPLVVCDSNIEQILGMHGVVDCVGEEKALPPSLGESGVALVVIFVLFLLALCSCVGCLPSPKEMF